MAVSCSNDMAGGVTWLLSEFNEHQPGAALKDKQTFKVKQLGNEKY